MLLKVRRRIYTQGGSRSGMGTVKVSGTTTSITAFGTNLALIGQKSGSVSTFTETAPAPAKLGTFTLTSVV